MYEKATVSTHRVENLRIYRRSQSGRVVWSVFSTEWTINGVKRGARTKKLYQGSERPCLRKMIQEAAAS